MKEGYSQHQMKYQCTRGYTSYSVADQSHAGAGMVKRVRGVAHSMRVSPQVSNRMVDGARGPLNSLLADVFIFTDHMSGPAAGNSPGFGITLVAETTSGGLIGSEAQAEVHKEVLSIFPSLLVPLSNI